MNLAHQDSRSLVKTHQKLCPTKENSYFPKYKHTHTLQHTNHTLHTPNMNTAFVAHTHHRMYTLKMHNSSTEHTKACAAHYTHVHIASAAHPTLCTGNTCTLLLQHNKHCTHCFYSTYTTPYSTAHALTGVNFH